MQYRDWPLACCGALLKDKLKQIAASWKQQCGCVLCSWFFLTFRADYWVLFYLLRCRVTAGLSIWRCRLSCNLCHLHSASAERSEVAVRRHQFNLFFIIRGVLSARSCLCSSCVCRCVFEESTVLEADSQKMHYLSSSKGGSSFSQTK